MQGYSRRALLASAGALSAGALAGCTGGDDGGERECSGDQRDVDVEPAGDPDSDVTVAAYEDFECPGCGQYAQEVYPAAVEEFVEAGEVAYEHRDFPVTIGDEWSWRVPNAAFAVAEDAGEEAYYAFIKEVYQFQGEYSEDDVAGLAAELGADEDVVREAIEEEPFCEQINDSVAEAEDRDVTATPTVFVNDEQLEAPDSGELREAIEAELN
ncbi:DsbA family protein [Halalkalicoccus tibetensis]|uniref:DsbA family protein n=1 Tax=Halalkalicoccus tibetensis TaxID=175632 RepID=A0ABD5V916_9EURY